MYLLFPLINFFHKLKFLNVSLFIIIFKFIKYHYILELNNQYKQLETKKKKKFCFQLLMLYSERNIYYMLYF